MREPRLRLVGGEVVREGEDVTVKVPTANLGASALISRGNGLLVPKGREPEGSASEPLCTKCNSSRDVVLIVSFPGDDGFDINVCRTCMDRSPGKPLRIDMSFIA